MRNKKIRSSKAFEFYHQRALPFAESRYIDVIKSLLQRTSLKRFSAVGNMLQLLFFSSKPHLRERSESNKHTGVMTMLFDAGKSIRKRKPMVMVKQIVITAIAF